MRRSGRAISTFEKTGICRLPASGFREHGLPAVEGEGTVLGSEPPHCLDPWKEETGRNQKNSRRKAGVHSVVLL